jgi:SAM-dependent methyltransferase
MATLISPRVASAIRYLSAYSGSPVHWRVSSGDCPLCGGTVFISLHASPFMTRCVRCTANVTNLSLAPVIAKHFGGHYAGRTAYELSTFGSTLKWLQRHFASVTVSEYFPDKPFGSVVDGIVNQDVQRLTFPDESFDLVTSNQVMEHVPDDILGFSESLRVLKPGGALVFSVPLRDIPKTERKAYVDAAGCVQIIGEPEYHDSRLGGPGSALCFWHHSVHDIAERVQQVGFSEARLVKVTLCKAQRTPELVVYAVKAELRQS